MDAQAFLNLLKNSEQKANTSAETKLPEVKEEDTTEDFKVSNQPTKPRNDNEILTNKYLEEMIKGVGFDVDRVPNFTEIARRIMPNISEPVVDENLTNFDNHDIIKDISPARKNGEIDLKKEALRKLIAKYKG